MPPISASGSAWADSVESAARVIDPGSANDVRLPATKCRHQCPKTACTRSGRSRSVCKMQGQSHDAVAAAAAAPPSTRRTKSCRDAVQSLQNCLQMGSCRVNADTKPYRRISDAVAHGYASGVRTQFTRRRRAAPIIAIGP